MKFSEVLMSEFEDGSPVAREFVAELLDMIHMVELNESHVQSLILIQNDYNAKN